MKRTTAGWLESAKSDLDTIEEILSNDRLTHVVAFHPQQCIEKCFKAISEEFELTLTKTHELITLKNTSSSVYSDDIDEDILSLLNKLYIDSRYPGDFGLLPDGKPGVDDAKRFYECSRDTYKKVSVFLQRDYGDKCI
ncbi:MAG: HEPN domain-containing protein [Candidatus Brocadiaceae bacterium]|nr:HEPN domain-containing protein [Candidatus Brocadiaceae bacterium]